MSRHNILLPLSLEDVDVVWKLLENQRFEFSERDYAHFTSKRNGLHVTVYEKGPKMLVQATKLPNLRGRFWSRWWPVTNRARTEPQAPSGLEEATWERVDFLPRHW